MKTRTRILAVDRDRLAGGRLGAGRARRPAGTPPQARAHAGVDPARLAGIGPLVEAAIARKELPGAVVLVWHDGQVVYHAAFGHRAVDPSRSR